MLLTYLQNGRFEGDSVAPLNSTFPSDLVLLRQIVETTHEGVWAVDADERTRYVNPPMAEMLGCTREEMLEHSIFDFIFDEDREEVMRQRERRGVGGREVFDFRYRRKDGSAMWARVSTRALSDERGQFAGAINLFTDITARKRREENLAFLADIQYDFTQLSVADEILRVVGEKITRYLNLSHCLFVEIHEEEGEASVFYDHHAGDAADLAGLYKLSHFHTEEERSRLAAGKAISINDVRECSRDEAAADGFEALGIRSLATAPYVRKGRWKFALSAQRPQPSNWRADEVELLRDMATRLYPRIERAHAEEDRERLWKEVEMQRARLQMVLQQMPEGVIIAEAPSGKLILGNKRVAEIWRHPYVEAEGVEGYHEYVGFHRDGRQYRPEEWPLARTVMTGEVVKDEEINFLRGDRTRGILCVSSAPIRDSAGSIVAGVVTFIDITERKRAEAERERLYEGERRAKAEAERANQLKDEFLATLSHELRTPLTSILGWSRMLLTGEFEEGNLRRALSTIERNARAQTQLIDDLLDVSRIMTGKLRIRTGAVDLRSVIINAAEAVRPTAEAKQIRLQTTIKPDVGVVSGDADRLQQVVWNLLSNAVKFTPTTGSVQINLRRVGSHAEITVSDTGEGIMPDFLPVVFDRFRQADQSTTRAHGGLGIGLAIVRQLVELHGGNIHARSAGEGCGATFTVSLPILLTGTERGGHNPGLAYSSAKTEVSPDRPSELKGLRVIVVDDEADTREMLQTLLGSRGASVTTAASAADALRAIEFVRPNVIISDIGMPGEDGYSLLSRVRQLADGAETVPIIALTAYAGAEDRVRALQAGFRTHITKPVDPTQLVNAVSELGR